jgi:hypothetical protein
VSAIVRHISLCIRDDHLPNLLRKRPRIIARQAARLNRRMYNETNVTRIGGKAAFQHHMPASYDR